MRCRSHNEPLADAPRGRYVGFLTRPGATFGAPAVLLNEIVISFNYVA